MRNSYSSQTWKETFHILGLPWDLCSASYSRSLPQHLLADLWEVLFSSQASEEFFLQPHLVQHFIETHREMIYKAFFSIVGTFCCLHRVGTFPSWYSWNFSLNFQTFRRAPTFGPICSHRDYFTHFTKIWNWNYFSSMAAETAKIRAIVFMVCEPATSEPDFFAGWQTFWLLSNSPSFPGYPRLKTAFWLNFLSDCQLLFIRPW